MKMRVFTLEVDVTVPATVSVVEVENAINAALDEPPCDWQDWSVAKGSIKWARTYDKNDQAVDDDLATPTKTA